MAGSAPSSSSANCNEDLAIDSMRVPRGEGTADGRFERIGRTHFEQMKLVRMSVLKDEEVGESAYVDAARVVVTEILTGRG